MSRKFIIELGTIENATGAHKVYVCIIIQTKTLWPNFKILHIMFGIIENLQYENENDFTLENMLKITCQQYQ